MSNQQSQVSFFQTYRYFIKRYIFSLWGLFLIMCFGFLVYSIGNVMVIEALNQVLTLIDGGTQSDLSRYLNQYLNISLDFGKFLIIFIVLAGFMRSFGNFLGSFFSQKLAGTVVREMRSDIYGVYLGARSNYFDQTKQGDLLAFINYHILQVTAAITDGLFIGVREGLFLLAIIVFLFYRSTTLTLYILFLLPIIGGIITFTNRRFQKLAKGMQSSIGEINSLAGDVIKGHQMVKAYGTQAFESNRFSVSNHRFFREQLKTALVSAITQPSIQLLAAIFSSVLIIIVAQGDFFSTSGEAVSFFAALATCNTPLKRILEVNKKIQIGVVASQSILQFMLQDQETDTGKLCLTKCDGRIEFQKVGFSYSRPSDEDESKTEHFEISDISFKIERGQTVVLVGSSGSGKSTIINLLLRLYNFDTGKILMDGVQLDSLSLYYWRSQMALVSQNNLLFNGTILDNIAYGVESNQIDYNRLEKAIQDSYSDFIYQFPKGLNTMIADTGAPLSGGQAQRVAIARALYKRAPILILDEATSSLDSESENKIGYAMDKIKDNHTIFIIAHRLQAAKKADLILVMREGKIAERGTHNELLDKKDSIYANLCKMQGIEKDTSRSAKATFKSPAVLPSASTDLVPLNHPKGWRKVVRGFLSRFKRG